MNTDKKIVEKILNRPHEQSYIIHQREIKKPRDRLYDESVQDALKVAWAAANYIASKRLAPFLKELVPSLERHGYLQLSEETRSQLISISPSTID